MRQVLSSFSLEPHQILDVVEASLTDWSQNKRLTGRILTLNSLENRVHEIEFEDGSKVVSKFYRPGRWNGDQIAEEHLFLDKLKRAEIPVVAPLPLNSSPQNKVLEPKTLGQSREGIFFAIFPKVRGRLIDEFQTVHLQTLGRYLGRIHQIGKTFKFKHRLQLNLKTWGTDPLEFLLDQNVLGEMEEHYEDACHQLFPLIENALEGLPMISVHGDCHLGNTLWQDESPFFLDFDDSMRAPAAQDIWMVIRGRDAESVEQRNVLLHSYESMCEFDRDSLRSIEALRALRVIHYSAWIAARLDDPGFATSFPSFGQLGYWRQEIEALTECVELLRAQGF